MTIKFTILGSTAGTGVPSFFCDCPGCAEARENPQYSRTRTGAFLDSGDEKILIDAPPDIRQQLIREDINHIDRIFLTHWHADHYSGLSEFEYYVRLFTREALPLYLPASAIEEFLSTFPDLEDVFHLIPWEFEQQYTFGDITLIPLAANHSVETAGFLVQTPGKNLAYFPDTAGLPQETRQQLQGIDYLICDATFYGENWYPHSHMSVEQAIKLGREIKAKQTILTHLSIHYSQPVTTQQLEKELEDDKDVMIAYDGLKLELSK